MNKVAFRELKNNQFVVDKKGKGYKLRSLNRECDSVELVEPLSNKSTRVKLRTLKGYKV